MIGLVRGLAYQAYKEAGAAEVSVWQLGDWRGWLRSHPTFGLVPCRQMLSPTIGRSAPYILPASWRFWQLIEDCPLKMPFNGR